ncbi:MAG: hypothetical protein K8T20_08690 [Planctomycetes bacterium]|nr:hypothetical protein [Planctomycetota bacterium]
MNPNFWGRAFLGLACGAILVGVVRWRMREGPSAVGGRVEIVDGQPLPSPATPRVDISRADAAMEIARLEAKVKDLEAKLAVDPRKQRGVQLAKALGAAAKAGWDSEEAIKADAALADFLAGLARDAEVDEFEFALNPARDALFAAFLEGFGLPLDESQAARLAELLKLEGDRWALRLEERKNQTLIERLASVYNDAADLEPRAAAILTADQSAALAYRFQIRYHSRNPQPWADHNNALGPREAPHRQLVAEDKTSNCYWYWYHDFLAPGSPDSELVKFYADWYQRELLGLEKPADLSGDKTVPPAYRAKQAALQAEVQKKMLEDARFGEDDKKRIREWGRLYDPRE